MCIDVQDSDGMTTFFAQRLNFIWILQIKHVIGEWSYHIIVKYERELILAFGLSCSFSILCWKWYTFMKKKIQKRPLTIVYWYRFRHLEREKTMNISIDQLTLLNFKHSEHVWIIDRKLVQERKCHCKCLIFIWNVS